jgi:hypothetical protein
MLNVLKKKSAGQEKCLKKKWNLIKKVYQSRSTKKLHYFLKIEICTTFFKEIKKKLGNRSTVKERHEATIVIFCHGARSKKSFSRLILL